MNDSSKSEDTQTEQGHVSFVDSHGHSASDLLDDKKKDLQRNSSNSKRLSKGLPSTPIRTSKAYLPATNPLPIPNTLPPPSTPPPPLPSGSSLSAVPLASPSPGNTPVKSKTITSKPVPPPKSASSKKPLPRPKGPLPNDFKRDPRKPSKDFTINNTKAASSVHIRDVSSNQGTMQNSQKAKMEPGPELDKRRGFIVKELLDTEETYVKALSTVFNSYYIPMVSAAKSDPSVPLDLIKVIFGNLETLFPINQDFKNRLKDRISKWDPAVTMIGDVFKEIAPFLKIYTIYGNNYDAAMDALDVAEQEPWFVQYCDKKLTLESLLITPIQRLPRYKLLFEDLLAHTLENHPDYNNLVEALKITKEIADHVNQSMKKQKLTERLAAEGFLHLLAPQRTPVMDGELEVLSCTYGCRGPLNQTSKLGKFRFLLFNDILVHLEPQGTGVTGLKSKKIASSGRILQTIGPNKKKETPKPKETKKKNWVEWVWPLELVILRDGSKTGFDIVGPNKTLSVMGDSQEIKSQWFNSLKTHIESRLMSQPKFSEIKDLTDLSVTLTERYGEYTFHSTEKYIGHWVNGVMHGAGIMQYLGTTWEGNFVEGRRGNEGKLSFGDGTIYVGEFENGIPNGAGESLGPNGDSYVGEWKSGRRHGVGDAIFSNGDFFIGEWSHGQFEGKGYFKTVNGICFEGSFKEGMFSGNGVLETPMGVYEGDFENNMRSGKGIMKYTDGSTYDGLWKDDKFHGKGTHTTSVGTYVGDFVKGQREGEGTFTFGNIFYDGSWKEGKFNGFGLFRSTNSYETQFEGEWEQGKKYKGIQSFADGSKWDGSFTNGKMSGVGKMTYPNGLVIEGKWKNGIRDGKMVTATRDNVKIAVEKGREESSNAEYLPPESFPFVDTQQWMSGL